MNPSPGVILVVYGFVFLFSFIGLICVGRYNTNFDGHCILFAEGNFSLNNATNELSYKLSTWGNSSNCNYLYFISFASTIFSLIMAINNLVYLKKQSDRTPFSTFMMFVENCILTLMMFVAACISSSGFASFCSGALSLPIICENSKLDSLKQYKVKNPGAVFATLKGIEFSLWFTMFLMATATALSFAKVHYFHRNNDLLQSLAYEKEKLISSKPKYEVIQVYDGEQD